MFPLSDAEDGPMPRSLKVFLWLVAGVGGLAGMTTSLWVLWQRAAASAVAVYKFGVQVRQVVHLLLYDLQTNSGGSLKDLVVAAAMTGKQNKEDIDSIKRDMSTLKQGQAATHASLGEVRGDIARLVVHRGDSNLQASQFLADERALKANIKQGGPLAVVPGSPYATSEAAALATGDAGPDEAATLATEADL